MARILILDLMSHSVCSWLNNIWMKDSYSVVMLVFGTWMIMKGWRLVLEHVKFCQLFLYKTMWSGKLHSGFN